MQATNVPVVDQFQFQPSDSTVGGIPAIVSFRFEWRATGPFVRQGKGTDVPAADPLAFTGRFAPAIARGSFSARELGFSFRSIGDVSSDRGGYALMGFESNGRLTMREP